MIADIARDRESKTLPLIALMTLIYTDLKGLGGQTDIAVIAHIGQKPTADLRG